LLGYHDGLIYDSTPWNTTTDETVVEKLFHTGFALATWAKSAPSGPRLESSTNGT